MQFRWLFLLCFGFSGFQVLALDPDTVIAVTVHWLEPDSAEPTSKLKTSRSFYDSQDLFLHREFLGHLNVAQVKLKPVLTLPLDKQTESSFGENQPPDLAHFLEHKSDRGSIATYLVFNPVYYDSIQSSWVRIIELEVDCTIESITRSAEMRQSTENLNSPLATGTWYKLPVVADGVHKIDFHYLTRSGIDPRNIDPAKIRLHGKGGRMLPQPNDEARPPVLPEIPVHLGGMQDNSFDPGDFILFYALGCDNIAWIPAENEFSFTNHDYSDTAFYFLNFDQQPGRRITSRQSEDEVQVVFDNYPEFRIHEKDQLNLLFSLSSSDGSGRKLLGEAIRDRISLEFKADQPALNRIRIHSNLVNTSFTSTSLKCNVNGAQFAELDLQPIFNSQYSSKGIEVASSWEKEADLTGGNLVKVDLLVSGNNSRPVYLDYLMLEYRRQLKALPGNLLFKVPESLQYETVGYRVDDASSDYLIWDVTDPLFPVNQEFRRNGTTVEFGTTTGHMLKAFDAFSPVEIPVPVGKAILVANQDLAGLSVPDMVIVTSEAFLGEAERLASFRSANDQLQVEVVAIREVYNEFSSGNQDPTAIRDFMRHLYLKPGGKKLKYLLLFGDSSFDYKNVIKNNSNRVPTYQSRDFVNPITSYASDDYFGFLDDDEGDWKENSGGDHLLDLAIGRLPANTLEEAGAMVNKIIAYHTGEDIMGSWRQQVIFLGDDEDLNIHQRDADRLAETVALNFPVFNVRKMYVDDYEQVPTSIGKRVFRMKQELEDVIKKGSLIINYNGHGNREKLVEEELLTIDMINNFENANNLPLFVTATCEFGRHDNPVWKSGAEYLLLNPAGGAIAAVTTARPVYSFTNFLLNRAFYEQVFTRVDGQYQTLGEIFRKTKNNSLNGQLNRNFILLGDPSMMLAYPKQQVRVNSISESGSGVNLDTARALQLIMVAGEILDGEGNPDNLFDGELQLDVFGQPERSQTLGTDYYPFPYFLRDNRLFSGKARVSDGKFVVEFPVPKNIVYQPGSGKLSLYAARQDQKQDAAGYLENFMIGGSTDVFTEDTEPPVIKLYLDDESFRSGGISGPDPVLIAEFADQSGINLSTTGIGNGITLRLDQGSEIDVTRFYQAGTGDFTKGKLVYPIFNLEPGLHRLTLRAWDIFNNPAIKELEFRVLDDGRLLIENLRNFPNPVYNSTVFAFEHNRAGESLEGYLMVYSIRGELVYSYHFELDKSGSRIILPEWYACNASGKKLHSGVYLYRLNVRSKLDNSYSELYSKLILHN